MAKNNPLFVDSTLHQGDSIGTQIELSGVVVLEGEALYIVLTNDEAEEICLAMEQVDDTDFEVFVRLVHQKKISFYFGIAKEGELLYKSETYERIARYALIEEWRPIEKLQTPPKKPTVSGPLHFDSEVEDAMDAADFDGDLDAAAGSSVSDFDDLTLASDESDGLAASVEEAALPEPPPAEAPMPERPEPVPFAVKTNAPILMPEDVMNITSLLNKWGFT